MGQGMLFLLFLNSWNKAFFDFFCLFVRRQCMDLDEKITWCISVVGMNVDNFMRIKIETWIQIEQIWICFTWYWIRLDWLKGDYSTLICALLSSIHPAIQLHLSYLLFLCCNTFISILSCWLIVNCLLVNYVHWGLSLCSKLLVLVGWGLMCIFGYGGWLPLR